jgi:hypothetical protein
MIKETLTFADELWTYRHTSHHAISSYTFSDLGKFPNNDNNKNILIKFLKCAQNFSLQE